MLWCMLWCMSMVRKINMIDKIEKGLPVELLGLAKRASGIALSKNLPLYLVGGVVRDLLLGQSNLDLDLVVEGDASGLAKEFAEAVGGKLTVHPMFNTASVKLNRWKVDFAMARTETYARPGALPAVKAGTLKTDLFRRDFTINAMAVCLNLGHYGELIDLYGGREDLKNKLIRVLHDKSFTDDATRIWRALRYEQRLGFRIEPDTIKLLKRDRKMLRTVGGYRLRRELELALSEKEPEKILLRADKLGVLKELHPSLKADKWLVEKFQEARNFGNVNPDIYLRLLTCRLNEEEKTQITKYLRFSKEQVRIIK
jgi:tRNA nucleotidyltransferase (CCA-adding enzyme)